MNYVTLSEINAIRAYHDYLAHYLALYLTELVEGPAPFIKI